MLQCTRQSQLPESHPSVVIGTKEGTAKAITTKVGSGVTNMVLKNADGSDFMSINDYPIKDLLAAVLQGVDHPHTANVLSQLPT